jgi:hypothetical protein
VKLINTQTGIYEDVPADQVNDLIRSGTYTFNQDDQVTVEGADGSFGYTDAQTAFELIQNPQTGYSFKSEDERRRENREREFNTATEIAKTAVEGGLRGLTVGLSDAVLANTIADPERMSARKEINPVTATGTEIIGAVAPLLTPAGLVTKAGKISVGVDKIGRGVQAATVKGLRKAGAGKARVAGLTARGAAEGGLYGVGQTVSEASLGEADFNAEALLSNISKGAFFGAGTGAVFGLGSEKIRKSVLAAKQEAADELKKAFGAKLGGGTDELNPSVLEKVQRPDLSSRPMIEFSLDSDTGLYTHASKKRSLELDPAKYEGKVLNVFDEAVQEDMAIKLGVPDISQRINESYSYDKGLTDFLERAIFDTEMDAITAQRVNGEKIAQQITASLQKTRQALDKQLAGLRRVTAETTALKERLAKGDVSVTKRLKERQAKAGELFKGYKRTKKQYQELANEKIQAANLPKIDEKAISRRVDAFISEYDAISRGNKLFVQNGDSVLNASNAYRNASNKAADFTASEAAILRLVGAKSGDILKNNPQRLKDVAAYTQDILGKGQGLSRKNFQGIDEIKQENLERISRSELSLEDTLNQMTNYFADKGISTGISVNRIKSELNRLSRALTEEGQGIKPALGKTKPLEEINEIQREISRVFGQERELAPKKLVNLRRYIQKQIKWQRNRNNPNPDADFEKVLKSYQKYLNDQVYEKVSRFADTKPLAEAYKEANKTLSVGYTLDTMVSNALRNQSLKKGIPFPDLLTGTIGFSVGSAPLALGALAGKKFYESYSDNLIGLYGDEIAKKALSMASSIRGSAKGFLASDKVSYVRPVGMVGYSLSDYEKDKKRIENGLLSPESITGSFLKDNESMVELLPDTSLFMQESLMTGQQMLLDKFPKAPSDNPFYQYQPTQEALNTFDRYKTVIQDPKIALEQFRAGYMPMESVEVLKVVYPKIYNNLRDEVMEQSLGKNLNYYQRQQLHRVFGIQTNRFQDPRIAQILNQPQQEQQSEFSAGQQSRAGKSEASEEAMTATQRLMNR